MSEAPKPEVIRLSLPSRLELLSVLDRVSLSVCERMGFDEDTTTQVGMGVVEAGTNAVQHGHKRDASLNFEIEFHMYPEKLEVHVFDRGTGFDVQRVVPDVTTPEHLFDMRGRGIFIMRSCCDDVTFSFSDAGTHCVLVKNRPAGRIAADA